MLISMQPFWRHGMPDQGSDQCGTGVSPRLFLLPSDVPHRKYSSELPKTASWA